MTISLSPPSTPRLRMRPPHTPGSPRPPLDGGWWPRSADPVAELPGLVMALRAHGPTEDRLPIAHILLRVADWNSRPRRLRVDDPADTRVVRLSWFQTLPAGLLTAIHTNGRRVDLLIVPAATGEAAARAVLELAADSTNRLQTRDLLATLPLPALVPTGQPDTGSLGAWESEGGRVPEPLAPS
jgi:Family of unknown function (DUF5994)